MAVALLLVHLIFEYLRLHQIWPILGMLKVQTTMLAALLLIVLAETAKGGVRLARQSWYLLGFLALAVFTILPATNQYYAFRFAYGLTLVLIGYFAITHILQNERDLKRFLSLLVGIHIYLAIKGIFGYAHSDFDPTGYTSTGQVGGSFLGDENDIALAMILTLPLTIYLLRQARSLPARLFWGAGSVVILLTILFTFSRGGFVGLATMMLYWLITSQKKGKAFAVMTLAAALAIAVAPSEYWTRIETIKDTSSGTAMKRRNNWAAARRMFYDSPIWGVGGHNFGVLLPDYAIEYSEEKKPTRWGRASHSMYFDLLAEFGLLGLLLIGLVVLSNFRDLKDVISLNRMGRAPPSMGDLAHCLRLSWVGFLVPAAFLSVLGYPHLYYLTALTVVVHQLAFSESPEAAIEPAGALQEAR
ncbi:MAG: O-antigen ligase family protein [Fidelibacterota bacterium]